MQSVVWRKTHANKKRIPFACLAGRLGLSSIVAHDLPIGAGGQKWLRVGNRWGKAATEQLRRWCFHNQSRLSQNNPVDLILTVYRPFVMNERTDTKRSIMSDQTISTIFSIMQDLSYTVVSLLCAAASYLTLQQPEVKQWLGEAGTLAKIVIFIALAKLLSLALTPIVSDLFALPRGLLGRDSGFTSTIQCLGGVLVLGGLAVGSWLLAKGPAATGTSE